MGANSKYFEKYVILTDVNNFLKLFFDDFHAKSFALALQYIKYREIFKTVGTVHMTRANAASQFRASEGKSEGSCDITAAHPSNSG